METLIESLRDILGTPEFYRQMGSSMNYSWDYGAMIEYTIAGCLLIVTVVSVFKFVRSLL